MPSYNEPGSPLDRHRRESAPHAGLVNSTDVGGPEIIVPPASVIAASAAAAWPVANFTMFHRFHVAQRKTYRYVNFRVGTVSGNVQVGVVRLTRSGTTVNATRVMSSGVIPCPGPNAARVDCGATELAPGDYALFLFCDNTTATFHHGIDNAVINSRFLFSQTISGGVPATVVTVGDSNRWVSGLTLETAS